MPPSKAKTLFKHSKMRFSERYDVNLTKELHDQICSKIRKGNGKFIENQSNRVTVWGIEHENKYFRVCYDKKRKVLITVLPI
jgi:hypothetical protein